MLRLSRPRDVRRVLSTGQHRAGRRLSLHAVVSDGASGSMTRFTVVASRRVGNAVRRNRSKRLLREAARAQSWRGGLDVVLIARSSCADSAAEDVRSELERLSRGLDVLAPAG